MKQKGIITLFFLALLLSWIMAAIVIRVPLFWFLIPDWLVTVMHHIFQVATQESSSDVEFLSAWLVCLALICGIALAWRFVHQ
jgi:hypothetical protein